MGLNVVAPLLICAALCLADGPWSPWRPFAAAVEIRIEGGRPTRYQLKSSVGVESPPCEM